VLPPWLSDFERRFRDQLEPFADHLRVIHPNHKIHIYANPWGGATGADGYIINLSCILPDISADQPDLLDLEISFSSVNRDPSAVADVCWGSPSGFIEAEWNEEPCTFSSAAQNEFFDALPRLMKAFEEGIHRGRPSEPDV
jgi:hypothetical protein